MESARVGGSGEQEGPQEYRAQAPTPAAPQPAMETGPSSTPQQPDGVVSRTVPLVGGGQLRIAGRPNKNGDEVLLRLALTGRPEGLTSWESCNKAHFVADGTLYPLDAVRLQTLGHSSTPLMNARARVGPIIKVTQAKEESALVVCGKRNVVDVPGRRVLLEFFKEFKPVAVEHGLWNPTLDGDEQESSQVAAPSDGDPASDSQE